MDTKSLREQIASTLPQSKLCFRCEEVECPCCDSQNNCPVQYRIADAIVSLIKANCWLKGEQTLIENLDWHLSGNDVIARGFKPCKEWEKE
jgi:hypothetical protein